MATNQPMVPSVLSELDRQELLAVERFGGKDTHINADESPWVPWVGDIEIKILRVENRTGLLVIALRSPTDQSLGKHRHRGTVRWLAHEQTSFAPERAAGRGPV